MRRFVGTFAVAAASAMSIGACDLELKPFVEPVDSGTVVVPNDSGGPRVDAEPQKDAESPVDAPVTTEAGDGSTPRKRVFVSSALFPGNLGGVVGANGKCQQAATAANLGGTFIAWLSVTGDPVLPRIQGTGPWYLVDRDTLVFANKTVITTVGPNVPIDRDEQGNKVVAGVQLVWTGTQTDGTAGSQNCAQFAQAEPGFAGLAGQLDEKRQQWTNSQNVSCLQQLHLYCIEQ